MKRLLWLVVGIPAAVLLILFSIANRAPISLSLDPFDTQNPAISIELPFFMFLFLSLLIGIVIGGITIWFTQARFRKLARSERMRAESLERRVRESENLAQIAHSRDSAA